MSSAQKPTYSLSAREYAFWLLGMYVSGLATAFFLSWWLW